MQKHRVQGHIHYVSTSHGGGHNRREREREREKETETDRRKMKKESGRERKRERERGAWELFGSPTPSWPCKQDLRDGDTWAAT